MSQLPPLGPIIPVSSRSMINAFLERHHYLGGLPAWKHAAVLRSAESDLDWIGVVVVGVPCSRVLMQRGYLEIRRLCLIPDAPKNAASYMLGYATRWSSEHGFPRVVSYADPSAPGKKGCPGDRHRGRIYLAANFRSDGMSRDHSTDGGWTRHGANRSVRPGGSKLRFVWGPRVEAA